MKKNITTKILAFIALFWIIISVLWTWILIFFWGNNEYVIENELTPEDLQRIIDSQKINIWSWSTGSWIELK